MKGNIPRPWWCAGAGPKGGLAGSRQPRRRGVKKCRFPPPPQGQTQAQQEKNSCHIVPASGGPPSPRNLRTAGPVKHPGKFRKILKEGRKTLFLPNPPTDKGLVLRRPGQRILALPKSRHPWTGHQQNVANKRTAPVHGKGLPAGLERNSNQEIRTTKGSKARAEG